MRPPGVVRSVFLAATSLLEDLGAFVAGNVLFGLALLIVVVAAQLSIAGNLLLIPLGLPAAGVMRMATVHVRRGTARMPALAEGLHRPWRTLGLVAVQALIAFLFSVDVTLGWSLGSVAGGVLAVAGFYGLLALWAYAIVAWTLILDPRMDDQRLPYTLRVAAFVAVSRPLPVLGLALLLAGVVLISVVSVLGIFTIGVALACLTAAHWVLPATDALLGRNDPDPD
jgi:hypothetical protein